MASATPPASSEPGEQPPISDASRTVSLGSFEKCCNTIRAATLASQFELIELELQDMKEAYAKTHNHKEVYKTKAALEKMAVDRLQPFEPESVSLKEQVAMLADMVAQQTARIDVLTKKVDLLTHQNARLIEDNARLIEDNARLIEDNARLIEDNAHLIEDNAAIKQQLAQQNALIISHEVRLRVQAEWISILVRTNHDLWQRTGQH